MYFKSDCKLKFEHREQTWNAMVEKKPIIVVSFLVSHEV